ncbi:MAG: type III-B CRISPR module-associated protein Cmr5 [Caldilineaceae bacterium]
MATQNQLPRQQSTEQKRAARAWQNIESVGESEQKKYGTLARKLPAMIQTNGLGQTLAFLRAKGGRDQSNGHNLICNHVSTWVREQVNAQGDGDLLTWIIQESSDAYRRATTESIVFAVWLRRFVEAKDWGDVGGDD